MINGSQRPRGSMGDGPLNGARDYCDDPRDEQANKRRKQSNPVMSRYFSKPPHPQPERIEDDEPASTKHTWPHINSTATFDLTRDGSQAETVDGSSVTSTGNTAAASSSQQQYRNVQNQTTVKRSGRQRRKSSHQKPHPLEGCDVIKHRHVAPQPPSHTVASPDVLAADDDTDPPPANIASDIVPSQKRPAVEHTQSTSKRFKGHNDREQESEDELLRPGTAGSRETAKRSSVVGKLISQSSIHSSSQRGDIQRTTFLSLATPIEHRRNMASSGPSQHDLSVAGAACGKLAYSTDGLDNCVKLHLEQDTARVVHERAAELSWLEIQKKSIQSAKHNNSHSCIVVVNRSIAGMSPLVLKFASESHATHFISWLHGLTIKLSQFKSYLESTFNNVMQKAKDWEETAGPPVSVSPNSTHKTNAPRSQPRPSHRDPFQGDPISPRRSTKLKDRMQGAPQPTGDVCMTPADTQDVYRYTGMDRSRAPETRRTRRTSPPPRRERTPDRWTTQNPDWDKHWHRSLIYPPTGKNRATVDRDDIQRLDEGEFLNDNLISFYLRYLQIQLEKEHPEVLQKVYIFNTFFFEKLRSNRAKINYDGVKAWTARVDLLSYEYIIVPVNENAHWYLAIIYNAPRLIPPEVEEVAPLKMAPPDSQEAIIVEDNEPTVVIPDDGPAGTASSAAIVDLEAPRSTRSRAVNGNGVALLHDEAVANAELPSRTNKRKSTAGNHKFSIDEPRIITLDSLGAAHPPTCKCLRDYLFEEAKHKKGIEITDLPGGMTARNIPVQDNYCDCGVFILGYMEHFLKDPDEAVRKLLQKENTGWRINAPLIRAKVRDLLFKFQHEQHVRLEAEKDRKRQLRAAKGPVSSPQVAPSSPQVPQAEPETPQVKLGPKSPLVNDIYVAASETPRQIGTTSSFFVVSSPEESTRPQTPRRNGNLAFLRPLEEDSNNEVKSSSSGEVYHSARSSPINSASRGPRDLITEGHSPHDERKTSKKRPTPDFVQQLSNSSSPKEMGSTTIVSALERDSSLEMGQPPLSRAPCGGHVGDGKSLVIASIEKDDHPSKGPQYDGIDRSINLT
ncbi:hypothetical protein F66182_33 [Fusarium sp. NRRL 66182]|nr:hypothetical protein F66182_33 [Fusarium sp. NRRL 66182]